MMRWDKTSVFAKMSRNLLAESKECIANIDEIRRNVNQDPAELVEHKVSQVEDRLSECCIGIVVFTACALESAINEYASRRLGSTLFKDHLEKLGIDSKWIVSLKMATGNDFPRDGAIYAKMKLVISYRNDFMHPKSSNVLFGNGELDANDVARRIGDHRQFIKFSVELDGFLHDVSLLAASMDPDDIWKFYSLRNPQHSELPTTPG